jgi:hypothetical protein
MPVFFYIDPDFADDPKVRTCVFLGSRCSCNLQSSLVHNLTSLILGHSTRWTMSAQSLYRTHSSRHRTRSSMTTKMQRMSD